MSNEVAQSPSQVSLAATNATHLESIDVSNFPTGYRAIDKNTDILYVLDHDRFDVRNGTTVLWTLNAYGNAALPGRWIDECTYCPGGTGPANSFPVGVSEYVQLAVPANAPLLFTAPGVANSPVPPPAGSTLLTLNIPANPLAAALGANALEIDFSGSFSGAAAAGIQANFRLLIDNVLVPDRGTGGAAPVGGLAAGATLAQSASIHKIFPLDVSLPHNVTVQWSSPLSVNVTVGASIDPNADNQHATLSVRPVTAVVHPAPGP